MRRGAKAAIVGGVFTGMLAVAGYGVYCLLDSTLGSGSASTSQAHNTSPPDAGEIRTTAQDFLSAWAAGDAAKAAGYTDAVTTATTALTGFHDKAHVSSLKVTPKAASGDKVPFAVVATLSYEGQSSTWSYDSSLTVKRGDNGKAVVAWQSSVLYPKLTQGASIETGRAKTPPIDVVDRHGAAMDPAQYPSLAPVLADLSKRYAAKVKGGTPGIETWINGADGTPGETLRVLAKGKPAKLETTLDADLQKAAEQAVKRRGKASVAAVRTGTGEILAFANNPATANNMAFNAAIAPGSTFKVLTATALLDKGVTPDQSAPCPQFASYRQGQTYHNVEKSKNLSATFAGDFAASCNTGFIKLADHIGESTLPTVAREVFGFGQTWNVGVTAWDGKVPGGGGDEMTAEMIGQGQIQMSPLNMASVAATAASGRFHQPRIVDTDLIGSPLATSSRPVPHQAGLKAMMRLTAESGTAAEAMSGLGGRDLGAKTGSAEVGGQDKPNGWFLAYYGDVAAGGVVLEGGHGGDSAGPIVAAVLRAS